MGNSARNGEPPKVGTLHANDIRHLWPCIPNLKHHEQLDIILIFTGRVLTRFSYRVCPDGTLVSREVPKFTDVDKAVSLVRLANQMRWTVLFDHELFSYEVTFDSASIIAWVNTDERLIINWDRETRLETAIQDRIISTPWDDDGRFLSFRYHWVRA
eukprot:9498104-Pyramimonas_sp.AAC.1